MRAEDISPDYLGEELISVELAEPDLKPSTGQVVQLSVGYSKTGEAGIVLPIEIIVQSPVAEGFESHVFRRSAPTSFVFTPIAAGPHLVLVRELFHNYWFGRLVFDVAGDELESDEIRRA